MNVAMKAKVLLWILGMALSLAGTGFGAESASKFEQLKKQDEDFKWAQKENLKTFLFQSEIKRHYGALSKAAKEASQEVDAARKKLWQAQRGEILAIKSENDGEAEKWNTRVKTCEAQLKAAMEHLAYANNEVESFVKKVIDHFDQT